MVSMFQIYQIFLFAPLPGEMIQFDEHIFQMGWFNHQLVEVFLGGVVLNKTTPGSKFIT